MSMARRLPILLLTLTSINVGQATLAAAEASRENGNSPNTVVSGAVAIVGKKMVEPAMDAAKALLNLFQFAKFERRDQ